MDDDGPDNFEKVDSSDGFEVLDKSSVFISKKQRWSKLDFDQEVMVELVVENEQDAPLTSQSEVEGQMEQQSSGEEEEKKGEVIELQVGQVYRR